MMLLSMLTNTASGLRGFVSARSLLNPDQLEQLLEGEQVLSDMERCSVTAGIHSPSLKNKDVRICDIIQDDCWCSQESVL